jgi:hypothetical protein
MKAKINLWLELNPTQSNAWRICQSNSFHTSPFLKEDSDGGNCYCHIQSWAQEPNGYRVVGE